MAALSYVRFMQSERVPIKSRPILGIRSRIHTDLNMQVAQPSTSDEIGASGTLRMMVDYWDLSIIGAPECGHVKQSAQSILRIIATFRQ